MIKKLVIFALFSASLYATQESLDLADSTKEPSDSTMASQDSMESAPPQSTFERYFAKNPAFGDKQNSIRFEFGASVRGYGFENHYQAEFIYSQPNHFFRLHGRLNLEIGGFFGFGSKGGINLGALNLAFAGVSEDILLPLFVSENSGNLYFGVGIGGYIKTKREARVGSNFIFGERVFVGYFYDSFNIEIFIKHFSNGTIERPNRGHNFFGVTAGWVF